MYYVYVSKKFNDKKSVNFQLYLAVKISLERPFNGKIIWQLWRSIGKGVDVEFQVQNVREIWHRTFSLSYRMSQLVFCSVSATMFICWAIFPNFNLMITVRNHPRKYRFSVTLFTNLDPSTSWSFFLPYSAFFGAIL